MSYDYYYYLTLVLRNYLFILDGLLVKTFVVLNFQSHEITVKRKYTLHACTGNTAIL